jgi:hypothetical protein
MIIDKPGAIFAKIKVLHIITENTLNLVLSDTKDAERWLETLIKMKIRLYEDKEEI